MQTSINYIGVDISKSFFDVALPNGQAYGYYKFDNNQDGFEALLKVVPAESSDGSIRSLLSEASKLPRQARNRSKCC